MVEWDRAAPRDSALDTDTLVEARAPEPRRDAGALHADRRAPGRLPEAPINETPAGAATTQAAEPGSVAVAPVSVAPKRRRPLRMILMLGGVIAAAAIAGYVWLTGGRWVSSDDAYIHSPKLMVSTDISGIVASVDVKESQRVTKDQLLFKVDPRQFEIALQAAEAQRAQVKINLESAKQDYQRLQADLAAQEAQVSLAQVTYDRASQLLNINAGTRATFDQARFTLDVAKRQLDSLRQQGASALTKLGGSIDAPVEQQPAYRQAEAQVEEARRQLDHTVIRAPFSGIVTAVDALQPGMFLVSQTAALTNTGAVALVSTETAWVDANMKETDLTYVKVGDPAEVTIDAYPGKIWHGHVESIAPASGSEFALIPAQNASGNWVKVVQRVPLRVSLDREPSDPALRPGMSAVVEIDTGHERHLSDWWTAPNHAPASVTHGDATH